MKKTAIEHQSFFKILLFFILVVSSSLFIKLSYVRRAFAGPYGSGNNFFYKGSFAFGTPPANKFITYQMMTYEAYGSVFTQIRVPLKICLPALQGMFTCRNLYGQKVCLIQI